MNLRGKPGRTIALVTVVAIMAFTLFGGAVLSQSLNNGIGSLEARLGADIAVVPAGSETDYEDIILTGGTPISFYFHRGLEAEIAAVRGVAEVTAQFHLAAMAAAACCDVAAQVIGIDYGTDFVVTPWIGELLHRQIGDGEVIIGSNIVPGPNNTITFFDTALNIAARLERTATGMDNTVYVSMNTARALAENAATLLGQDWGGLDVDDAISVILVRVDPGYDVGRVVAEIQVAVPEVGVVASSAIYSSISQNLNFFTSMIRTITIVLGVIAVFILAVLFSLIANGRKKEFAILRIVGATRKKLGAIVLTEAADLSVVGAVLGCTLAAIVVFPFGRSIGAQMGMPLLLPSVADSVRLFAFALILSLAVGPLAAAYSAWRISRAETYATMREGE